MALHPLVHCEDLYSEQVVAVCYQFPACSLASQQRNSTVLFATCSFVLSGGFSHCNWSIPTSTWKLNAHVDPTAADPLCRNPQHPWLVRCCLYLDRWFLWLSSPSQGQCQGPFKTSSPAVCLRQDVPLVLVQTSKS